MKDKFLWALLVLIVASSFFDYWDREIFKERIERLEEKAKHFRCLEKRIRAIGPIRANNGGWFIRVDSVYVDSLIKKESPSDQF